MALMVCPSCGNEFADVDLCPTHLLVLVPADSGSVEPLAAVDPGTSDQAAGLSLDCWNCGRPAPDVSNMHCAACGEPLTRPRLVLRFAEGQVTLGDYQRTVLGRDPAKSPHARLFRAHMNVSRVHATVGVDEDGQAWIFDAESVNGTFVNDQEITPKIPTRITDGDRIRLAADVRAEIRVYPSLATGGAG